MVICRINVGPSVFVGVDGAGVPGPTVADQLAFRGDIREESVTEVLEQDAVLGAIRFEVAAEGVLERFVEVVRLIIRSRGVRGRRGRPLLPRGVPAHVGQEQVQQAVTVKIKEDRAGGMSIIT